MYNEGLYFEKYDIKNLQKYEFSGWISRLVTVGVDYGAGDGSDCFEIKVSIGRTTTTGKYALLGSKICPGIAVYRPQIWRQVDPVSPVI